MNEPTQNPIEEALRSLRELDASRTAPDVIEGKLLHAFQSHHDARRYPSRLWIPAAVAASLMVALASWMSEPEVLVTPTVQVSSIRPPERTSDPAPGAIVPSQKMERRVKRRVERERRPLQSSTSRPVPSQHEFVHIPYAPPFIESDEGHVVRVNMAGSSARRMGIPVLTNRVQADLVVGNDGLPRAIRVISDGVNPNR